MSTFAIKTVDIEITYPDDSTEMFSLKRPYTFEFRFKKIAKLPDYRDAFKRWQPGCYFYQFMATYDYEHHDMDLRKLLVAKKIVLKFPPVFDDTADYQSAEVLLANDEVPKNYLQGLALAENGSDSIPSGSVTLEFEGTEPINESELRLNYLFGTGGGSQTYKNDHFLESEEFGNLLLLWQQEVGETYTPSQYYMLRGDEWGVATAGPDTNSRVGVDYNVYHTYTDENGVLHLVYVDENSDLWYSSFDGSWSTLINFDAVDYAYYYMNVHVHNGNVYVFYLYDSDIAYIWDKTNNTIIDVSPTSDINFSEYSDQGDRAFFIASDGTWYVALGTYDGLMIKTSTDQGSSWDEFTFADYAPYNNPFQVYAYNLAFAEDSSGVVHITFVQNDASNDRIQLCRLSSVNWETATEVDVIHNFYTFSWSPISKNYMIDDDDVHHIVLRGPDSGGSPELLGYANEFETYFDEADPLEFWTIEDLNEPEGSEYYEPGFYEDPDDGIYRNQAQDSEGYHLNYYAEMDAGPDKTGYMSWDLPGSYTHVEVEMTAEMSGPNKANMFLYVNGNAATIWEDFEGYLFSFQKFEGGGGNIYVYKKQAGDTTRPTYFSDLLMGSVSHQATSDIATIQVEIEEFEEDPALNQEQENRIAVKVYNQAGIHVGNKVFIDSTNPIQHAANTYGVYHETVRLAEQGVAIDKNVYYYRVTDLNSAHYSDPVDIIPGLWHFKGANGNWSANQILETNEFEAEDPYAILNGSRIHVVYYIGDKIYMGTHSNGSWSFEAVHTFPHGEGSNGFAIVLGTYEEAE